MCEKINLADCLVTLIRISSCLPHQGEGLCAASFRRQMCWVSLHEAMPSFPVPLTSSYHSLLPLSSPYLSFISSPSLFHPLSLISAFLLLLSSLSLFLFPHLCFHFFSQKKKEPPFRSGLQTHCTLSQRGHKDAVGRKKSNLPLSERGEECSFKIFSAQHSVTAVSGTLACVQAACV